MQIRRKTEKPMVIHTKQKTRIHAKGKQETKIKGRNVLTVTRSPGLTGKDRAQFVHNRTRTDTILPAKRNTAVISGRAGSILGKSSYHGGTQRPVRKNRSGYSSVSMAGAAGAKIILDQTEGGSELYAACMTADMLTKPVRSAAHSVRRAERRIKNTSPASRISVRKDVADLPVYTTDIPICRKTAECRQPEGVPRKTVNDFQQSFQIKKANISHHVHNPSTMQVRKKETEGFSNNMTRPAATENIVTKNGAQSFLTNTGGTVTQNAVVPEPKRASKKSTKNTVHKPVRKTTGETVKKTAQKALEETAKKVTKEAVKQSVRATASAAGTAVGTATTGAGGVLTGIAAGEAAGIRLDRHDMKVSAKKRMIQLYVAKLKQEENQDSIVKALRDIVLMRFSIVAKYVTKYTALFLAGVLVMVAFTAVPVISMLAVIYNSPFAILFPSISASETTQEVLAAYVSEFNEDIEDEMGETGGCDRVKKVYVGYDGDGVPDNFSDILAVYMVKHGNGDTATDMTDKAKQNLKKIFGDMCSYNTSSGTETETEADENGNDVDYSVKYVNITLKTYSDMISVYSFNTEEQELFAELMKPEYQDSPGYQNPDSGQELDPDRYRAIVDSVSDANGKKVLEFALSKVGYPYSQEHRDDGAHFDCSSLAYYAWRHAGVSISYQGSTSAAYEGKLCYDNGWLVHYGDMQPGDLIFFSYDGNGRFMDISHVAIYAGDGMIVEAANKRIGVVYRPIHSRSSIVMIGRPR